jgi:2-haloacid dehalogenase
MPYRYDAVLFDLLTALLDSWTLWDDIAGGEPSGRRWRTEYLRLTYGTGAYRRYETLVAEAAATVGLDRRLADTLAERYSELQPWPGVAAALSRLAASRIPLGIATNCSEDLARLAADRLGVPFTVLVSAERAGFYKPDPHVYRMALHELQIAPERCLFVAGSAYDLIGAAGVGMATWWHDRIGMAKPATAPEPIRHTRSLEGLPEFVLGD